MTTVSVSTDFEYCLSARWSATHISSLIGIVCVFHDSLIPNIVECPIHPSTSASSIFILSWAIDEFLLRKFDKLSLFHLPKSLKGPNCRKGPAWPTFTLIPHLSNCTLLHPINLSWNIRQVIYFRFVGLNLMGRHWVEIQTTQFFKGHITKLVKGNFIVGISMAQDFFIVLLEYLESMQHFLSIRVGFLLFLHPSLEYT